MVKPLLPINLCIESHTKKNPFTLSPLSILSSPFSPFSLSMEEEVVTTRITERKKLASEFPSLEREIVRDSERGRIASSQQKNFHRKREGDKRAWERERGPSGECAQREREG